MLKRLPAIGAAAFLLLAPLGFYFAVYVGPMIATASYSIDNSTLVDRLPETSKWAHEGEAADDRAAASLLADLSRLKRTELAEVARLLNQDETGFRSLLMATGDKLKDADPSVAGLVAIDGRWAEPRFWHSLAKNLSPYTWRYFQNSLGIVVGQDGSYSFSWEQAVYLSILGRTFIMSVQISLTTLLLGYPIAYAIANGSPIVRNVFVVAVLLSFWTSILVRTTAWVVLLQSEGLVNRLLVGLGIVSQPLELIFNRFGTLVATAHVLLPFAILPIVNVMRQIPNQQRDASRSLGAGPAETFLRVYLPQTWRGVMAGGGIVFVLSLGFYLTPALVGGPGDQMISYYIADFMRKQLNWGMASALSVLLVGCVALAVVVGHIVHRAFGKKAIA